MKPWGTALVAAGVLAIVALMRRRDAVAVYDQFGPTEPKARAPGDPPAPVVPPDPSQPPPWERMALRAPIQLLTQRTYCAAIQLEGWEAGMAKIPDDIESSLRGFAQWRTLEIESPPPEGLDARIGPDLYFAVGELEVPTIAEEIPPQVVALWSQPSTR